MNIGPLKKLKEIFKFSYHKCKWKQNILYSWYILQHLWKWDHTSRKSSFIKHTNNTSQWPRKILKLIKKKIAKDSKESWHRYWNTKRKWNGEAFLDINKIAKIIDWQDLKERKAQIGKIWDLRGYIMVNIYQKYKALLRVLWRNIYKRLRNLNENFVTHSL